MTRPKLHYAKGVNKNLFYLVYCGSIVFWLMLFVGAAAVILFLIFPLIKFNLPSPWPWLILAVIFIFGWFVGMVMAQRVVQAVIQEGIKSGDITVVKPDSNTHNAEI